MSLTKASYSMITGAPVNVLDYGATGDGVTDDTAAFNAAIATGKKVYVPIPSGAGYVVNNIAVLDNMVIEGEKNGRCAGPTLMVTTNNAGAFLHSSATAIFQIEIRNFVVMQKTGVTGASAYKQNDKSVYTAYAKFENIETYRDLLKSYDGFFIFTEWNGCRDGYVGNYTTQGHGFIDCKPALWNQGNQCNINTLSNTQCFGATAGTTPISAAVDIGYGAVWTFDRCDFETLSLQAVQTQGIYGVNFKNCWFERIVDAQMGTFTLGLASTGTRPVEFENCYFDLTNTTANAVAMGAASQVSMRNCMAANVPTGVRAVNASTQVCTIENMNALSGSGKTLFTAGLNVIDYSSGKTLINGAVDNGTSSVFQIYGIVGAQGGVFSAPAVTVTTVATPIATCTHAAGLCFVKVTNNSGGNGGWWLVAFNISNAVATIINSYTVAVGLVPTFSVSGADLYVVFASGSGSVSTSLLV